MEEQLKHYLEYLKEQERSQATLSKYAHDIRVFLQWAQGRPQISKQQVIEYKQWLIVRYAPASVNSMLAALNGFLSFAGLACCRVKALRIQRQSFRAQERELTREEYLRLLAAARQKSKALWLAMQTLCSAGLRVSELQYVTVRSSETGRVEIFCKGKQRVALLPKALRSRLARYAKAMRIHRGPIFTTSHGAPWDRSHIWAAMKRLCSAAHVPDKKVFPHNLRHLFAHTYYDLSKDLLRLADLLGHSSVNTTRIYTAAGPEQAFHQIERLRLIQ